MKSETFIKKSFIVDFVYFFDTCFAIILYLYITTSEYMIDCRIIVVDNDVAVLKSLRRILLSEFSIVVTVSNPAVLPALLNEGNTDIVLLDMNFSAGKQCGEEGVFWLNHIFSRPNPPSVIVMTAFETVNLAVRSFKNGAVDFIHKPWDNESLFTAIKDALEARKKRTLDPIIEESQEMIEKDSQETNPDFIPISTSSIEDVEKQLIKHVLEKNSGNLSVSADVLKITRQTLYNKIKKYQL